MPSTTDKRVRHAASHKVGANDPVTPASIGGSAAPIVKTSTGNTATSVSVGNVNQAIVPLRWRTSATAPAGNSINVRVRIHYSNGTNDDATATIGAATTQVYSASWEDPQTALGSLTPAQWNLVETEQGFHVAQSGTSSDSGKQIESMSFDITSGAGGTATTDFRCVQF